MTLAWFLITIILLLTLPTIVFGVASLSFLKHLYQSITRTTPIKFEQPFSPRRWDGYLNFSDVYWTLGSLSGFAFFLGLIYYGWTFLYPSIQPILQGIKAL